MLNYCSKSFQSLTPSDIAFFFVVVILSLFVILSFFCYCFTVTASFVPKYALLFTRRYVNPSVYHTPTTVMCNVVINLTSLWQYYKQACHLTPIVTGF